jgi:hypothetical protein
MNLRIENCSGRLLALVVSILILHLSPALADILDGWHWRNPAPFTDTMHSICFGAGTFVAVGENGVIHASTDGTNWDGGHRPVIFDLNKVIYADGKFVAVGNGGNIVTSTDGTNWVVANSGTTNNIYVVGYGNGKFVADTLNEAQLLISENGTDWTMVGTLGMDWITFGNGVFVGGGGLSGNVLVSSDGLTWTGAELPYLGHTFSHQAVEGAFGNGTFVAMVEGETNSQPASFFYSSVDGTNWVQKSLITLGPGYKTNYTAITNSGGEVVIISEAITDAHRYFGFLNGAFHEVTDWVNEHGFVNISVTSDGTSYTTTYAPTNAPFAQSMAYGNGKYVLIEVSGKTWVSTDETNWVEASSGSRARFNQVVQGNGKLVVVGPMLVSSDGITFNNCTAPPTNSMVAAASDGTNFVAVGGKQLGLSGIGYVATSTNGSDWVDRTNISGGTLSDVCHAAPGWVAVGNGGGVFTSQDTLTWTRRSFRSPNGVTYGNGIYVAVGNSGAVITSSDGATWTVQSSGTTKSLFGIAFQNGQFTAVGGSLLVGGVNDGGTIITSPDGVNWTTQISTTQSLRSIACGAGSYLVRGTNDIPSNILVPQSPEIFLTSTNGTNWSDVSTKIPTATSVRSIAYINQSFWIVGDNGMLLQSDVADGIPHLGGAMISGNGGITLKVTLNPAASYRVQFRTNMLDTWRDIYTNANPASSTTWTDTNSSQLPSGFYRIVTP